MYNYSVPLTKMHYAYPAFPLYIFIISLQHLKLYIHKMLYRFRNGLLFKY